MDPWYSRQDVLRCHHCENPLIPTECMHCDICDKYLCSLCVGKHLLDQTKQHKVVPFQKRGTATTCSRHSSKICELYCKQCSVPICALCASKEHRSHDFVHVEETLESQREVILKDLQELENSIFPTYQLIASEIPVQKADLAENSKKLTTSFDSHGQDLHKAIDTIIKKMKTDLNKMDSTLLGSLTNREKEIAHTIAEIKQAIADLKKILNSNDVSLFSAYKSKNSEFRNLPPKLTITLPSFIPHKVNSEHLYQQFGSLSAFSTKTETRGYVLDPPCAESFSLDKPLIDKPRIITEIKTKFNQDKPLRSISLQNDKNIWTSGSVNLMRLYNLQGNLMKSVETKSGMCPNDIGVSRSGYLLFTDDFDRTVNTVKNSQIETVIRLKGWTPRGVCSTSSGDLLVVMDSDDRKQAKVVRYSGPTEKQTIQFDEKEQPFYYFGYFKYIVENRNLDICVSDTDAYMVVVVNHAGKHRFTYTGNPSTGRRLFAPRGITTDSHSRIFIADYNNHCIHILDQNGQFLRYIDNCQLRGPWGVCVDSKDNLFVSENYKGKVKKIKYCK